MTRSVCGSLLLSVAILFAPTIAQAQVKPRIVIAFDTSGSMGQDLDGVPTFGDGVTSGCTGAGTNASPFCGANCTAGVDTNCDGEPNDSRIFIAKNAVANMVSAFGDVDWALARFSQDQGTNTQCLDIGDRECSPFGNFVTSFGNPQCNSNGTNGCSNFWEDQIPNGCRPGNGGRPAFEFRTGGDPLVCINYDGQCSHGTPARGGDILVGFSDLGPFTGLDNTLGIYSWLNGTETNFVNSTTRGNYCNSSSNGDCELRPDGSTPLAGILDEAGSYLATVQAGDTSPPGCRPYSVILLTDGAETCGGDPSGAAATLLTAGVNTYVVGLAISAASRTALNGIAAAGGTDASGGTGDEAFFADNQTQLAAGLAQIVADSLLSEVCNGADDDCDTLIDEGVLNACGTCGAVPVETCNGLDDDCNGIVDDGVLNACGTCGPAPTEICDGIDNDCDGTIDENNVCAGCTPSPEICDGLDNNCNGSIDEGLMRPCGSTVGLCTVGNQTCTAGTWGMCSGIGPTPEACDGDDNDCDGIVDGITRPCGSGVGECIPGAQICMAGGWGACTGAVGPATEICDNLDNNCNGSTDEGNPEGGGSCGTNIGECSPGTRTCSSGMLVCSGETGPVAETCNGDDDDCDGATDEGVPTMGACGPTTGECRAGVNTCVGGAYSCVGAVGPSAEVCDGRDNNCNGSTDEGNPGGGVSCGSSTGVCSPGTSQCVGGSLVCQGGTGPGAEICDGLDNDCNGIVDDGNPGGGPACGMTDVGECELGALACMGGALVCVGATDPTAEICDNLDNDCDSSIDEMNPEGGAMCGDDTGECTPGTTLCMGGTLICDGGTGPVMEICDGLDNDCDGVEDEGLGVGAPCGSDIGECSPGVNICELGGLVCTGEIGPREEECNLLDDDCDGAIDELSLGGSCGSDEGLCMAGMEQCIDGALVCMGAVDPSTEGCDCSDNDCDGAVDEGDSICPTGTACRDCGCADPCVMSEFGFTCPTGTTPEVDGAECYCVAPRCNADECGTETIERDGETLCAPDASGIANCVCRNNDCTFSCDGVVCAAGLRCDPRDPLGRCVEDNCRGLGCPEEQVCNRITSECETDACADVTCGSGEACRDGVCEGSCATVMCAASEECIAGACVADACADVTCPVGQYCDESGACAEDACVTVNCPAGTVCDPASGDCSEDPCSRLNCPDGEVCLEGECTMEMVTPDAGVDAGPVDAGVDTGSGGEDPFTRVLATGGGGCTCSVPGAEPAKSDDSRAGALAFAFGLFGLVFWRRRRLSTASGKGLPLGKAVLVAMAAIAVFLSSGCDVDPYCIDCVDGSADATPDTGVDTGIVRPDTGTGDTGIEDAGTDTAVDGCVPGAPELCNGFDDDCDGDVDEDIDTDTDVNNCGGCGMRCAPENAFAECVAGACQLGSCRTGYYDLDGDDSNGCEYRCSTLDPLADDSLCDLRDNDCDGVVDEDVAFDTDPLNCGTCGTVCRFAHAAGACAAGACALGACDVDFYDIDGAAGNGCEYSCTPAVPATEACNSVDDDCDGAVDQGNPGGGGVCGSDTGECSIGVERCVDGDITCFGEVAPTTELCNGLDDDCDGVVDQGDPEGGALCGSSIGACTRGREVCTGGALVCTGGVTPTTETCNGLDDDCDGSIDEMNPGGGGACGPGTGACMPGILNCRGGVLVCEGAVGSTAETCNNTDDDCDGMVDENNPEGGGSCGSDIGACIPGSRTCMGGSLVCVGQTGPGTETCNGIDDDCSGAIDEGNPGGGTACGNTTGACTAGMEVCTAGALVCSGGTGPTLETCNGIDDDCDGTPDQLFSLMTDINNCGSCGNVCSFPNAIAGCSSGTCVVLGCEDGWVDLDAAPGCDYACDFNGTEVCNGLDDDCDGTTDIGVTPPAFFCNPNGVCSGTTASCGGAAGWECNYPAAYEETEVSCDGDDNDCNGIVDDGFNIGAACSAGQGRCRGTGTVQCTSTTAAACNATPAATALPNELCNAIDDDCDGTVDEAIPLSSISTVEIAAAGGGTVRVMQYEASRPDADDMDAGGVQTMACSNPDTLPWTTVTWNQARAACQALNNGVMSGWDLCDEADWESACEGPGGPTCDWSYSVACTSSTPTRCNGEEFDSSGAAGDQDALYPTASTAFGMCFTDWAAAGVIYDLSGNVKEWTRTPAGAGNHIVRGGSYNNIEPGRTCTFDWTVAPNSFAFPNTGFRCCNY